ncbi:hypothetical protein FRC18_003131 [Serendipita sp. 400]|nr:hypothetical protein FRC18_003131 [Serendipita sp. 400]
MPVIERLRENIPSPNLHLLDVENEFSTTMSVRAVPVTLEVGRNKTLPSIPSHGNLPFGPVRKVQLAETHGHLETSSTRRRRDGRKSPTNTNFVRALALQNTALRASKGTHDRPVNIAAKILHQHSGSQDRPYSPRYLTPSRVDVDNFDTPDIINISPAASVESVVLKPTTTQQSAPKPHLADPPPRTFSRRNAPAPIRIPNGRIHGPAILVEREIDPADLESRISTSMKAPRVPRKSTKRKTREGAKAEQPAGKPIDDGVIVAETDAKVAELKSKRISRAISVMTTNEDAMTETSNDEYRFSLGFLMQPERMSVMSTRTGRADSATLPELSPFLASDSYIPPVPAIPASLKSENSGPKLNEEQRKVLNAPVRPLKPLQKPNGGRRSPIPPPGASPLASAYSHLAANSRPYVAEPAIRPVPTRRGSGVSDGSAEYSPAFTAASPLDSPERNAIKLLRQDLFSADLDPSVPAKALPNKKERDGLTTPPRVDNNAYSAAKSPALSSTSSVATPELSPSPAKRIGIPQEPSSTPESGSSLSQYEGSISNFEMVTRSEPEDKREPSPFQSSASGQGQGQQQRHRTPLDALPMSAVPRSAVPMSAITSALSSASLDQFLETISFGGEVEPAPFSSIGFAHPARSLMELINKSPVDSRTKKDIVSPDSTFAPNHPTASKDAKESKSKEPKKLKFPPIEKSPQFSEPVLSVLRDRRNSLPSPINSASPNTFKFVSPLTGGPTTILFTPSSHQPLHAALSGYSSSGFGTFSLKGGAKEKLRAVDDAGFRVSNLSIKTDHTRTVPRADLVPYTPFSQASDSFSPGMALITSIEVIKSAIPKSAVPKSTFNTTFGAVPVPTPAFPLVPLTPLAPLPASVSNTLSNSIPAKLATRSRTRPPMGPRKQRNSTASTSKTKATTPQLTTLDPKVLAITNRSRANTNASNSTRSRADTTASVGDLHFSLLSLPTTPNFEVQPIKFRGLTLDVAKWTFDQDELQEISRRAISQSADPLGIRLVPLNVLDKDVVDELERLEMQREELKANFKYQHRRRVAILGSMHALLEGPGSMAAHHHHHHHHHHSGSGNSTPMSPPSVPKLFDELREAGIKTDQITEELYGVCDQIAQMRALQDSHSASALAMALRKINASYIKSTAELADAKAQLICMEGEREDAWAMAHSLERELNELKATLEMEREEAAETAASLAAATATLAAATAAATAAAVAVAATTANVDVTASASASDSASISTFTSASVSFSASASTEHFFTPSPQASTQPLPAIVSSPAVISPPPAASSSSEGSSTPSEATIPALPKKRRTRAATGVTPLMLSTSNIARLNAATKTIVSAVFPEEVPMMTTENGGGGIGGGGSSGISRVLAARRMSTRRSKASLRSARFSTYSPHFSSMFSSITIPSAYFDFQSQSSAAGGGGGGNRSSVPPLPTTASSSYSIQSAVTKNGKGMVSVPATAKSAASGGDGKDTAAAAAGVVVTPKSRGRDVTREMSMAMTPRRRAESYPGTPLSFYYHSSAGSANSSDGTALMHAQSELLQMLGVSPSQSVLTSDGFRRTRSFSDADVRTSMFTLSPLPLPLPAVPAPASASVEVPTITEPVNADSNAKGKRVTRFANLDGTVVPLPPMPPIPLSAASTSVSGNRKKSIMFDSRESRIMSFYSAYYSRRNTAIAPPTTTNNNNSNSNNNGIGIGNSIGIGMGGNGGNKRRQTRMSEWRQTRMSEWGVEALYDGILDDPDTLFSIVKPGL